MESLIQNLQRTIRALETLSEQKLPEADQVDELLDQLFQQKIDLVNINVSSSSPAYQQAAQAMGQAAARVEKAVKEPSRLSEAVPVVFDAVGKLAKLLNHVMP
jgi:methyl-accepting chemotaxis protein